MIKNAKTIAMPSTDLNQLIQELINVHKRLSPKSAHNGPYFVLARLMQGMDQKAWTELCAKAEPTSWCALEVHDNPPSVQIAQLSVDTENTLTDNLLTANFMKQLEREVARASRSNAPLAVVRFNIVQSKKSSAKDPGNILQKSLQQYTSVCDFLGGINQEEFALILPGAKTFKAQNIVEDIIEFCTKQGLLLKAGIAGCMGKACQAETLFKQAELALIDASSQSAHVYKNPDVDLDATLVHSHEKRFLFGGN